MRGAPATSLETKYDVRWTDAGDVDLALAAHAVALLGPGEVASGRLCPACGSSAHGRPWLRHEPARWSSSPARNEPARWSSSPARNEPARWSSSPARNEPGVSRPHVSASRSGPHLVTVIAGSPVGVDVEAIAAVATRWDPTLVLADGEVAETPLDRARAWARKEAVLKARGTGLASPMDGVRLDAEHWADLPAPRGFVAAVSLSGT